MEESPGMDRAEPTPEASQTVVTLTDSATNDESLPPRRMPSKRASLPPRPHAAARHTKRLTLNFPINIPQGVTFDPSATSSPSGSMTPVTRSSARQSPAHTIATPPFDGQDDGTSLLTAIASQERRVLELREELHRAETELNSLKKQWTSSEKTRKRTEVTHRAEAMLPLRSPDAVSGASPSAAHSREPSTSGSASPVVPQVRLSRELERRQTMLAAAAASGTSVSASGRRVFQGSHTRALSLLSPTTSSVNSKQSGSETGSGEVDGDRIGRPPRSATMPSVDRTPPAPTMSPTQDMVSEWRKTMPVPPPSRDLLMRTGKQMASDLREGLWTFLEDIRQATVGDEGINATESRTMQPSRNRDSSSTSRSRDRLSVRTDKALSRSPSGRKSPGTKATGNGSKSADIDASFWGEFGIDSSGQKSPNTHRTPTTPSGPNNHKAEDPNKLDVDDTWDDWDTPQPKKSHTPSSSRSTIESRQDQSPVTQTSSPRTSASLDWRRDIPDPSMTDGIPWPAMTQTTPSKLSNLMAEWERSLSPSPNRSPLASPPLDKDSKKD